MTVWLRCSVDHLLDNSTNLSKNFIIQNILSLLIIFYKLGFLVDFCNNQENTRLVSPLLHCLTVDKLLFENSVRPLWNSFDKLLPYSILTVVKGAVNFNPPLPEWIFAIPLVHFLTKLCEPFEILHSIEWDHVGLSNHRYVYMYISQYL